ncbi:hypothetical protein QQF64_000408 [Cirrhinus molitorella]|uniref:SAM domain-containing protein n=1 Tax=Cirrhinus molitorella TaxID=172907 RepID=A0ABR3NYM9_9TELE
MIAPETRQESRYEKRDEELRAGAETESEMDVQIPKEPELSESEETRKRSQWQVYLRLSSPVTAAIRFWSTQPRSPADTASADTVWPTGGRPLGPGSASTAQNAERCGRAIPKSTSCSGPRAAPPQNPPPVNIGEFYSGVVTALTFMAMLVLLYHGFSADSSHEVLLSKPLSRWSTDDVTLWVEHLGVWTNQYQETFRREKINGRLLIALSDEDLSAAPFSIENQSHRQIFLEELHRLKETRVSLNLWQYKDLYLGKALFLLISLRKFPRLTLALPVPVQL